MGGDPLHPAPLIRLPTKAAKPEHTHALIVGIERYAAGPQWDLNGPLNDALAIRKWLLGSGVPAGQIHLHVSALEANHAEVNHLKIGHQEATDQALRKTIESLKKIPPSQAELLFLFWAGHGLISAEHQSLLLAHATDLDMACYRVDNLRTSFANDGCPGFAHQIFLFDTCRSFHRRPQAPPPGVELPSGASITKSQFLFFASQEGQAATNLGQEQCGLFTKVLLEQLPSSQDTRNAWPPDMESIVKSVQLVFDENQQQYPVYTNYRDWQGNKTIDPLPADAALNPGSAVEASGLPAVVKQLGDWNALNERLRQAILNGLGTADPEDAWAKFKAGLRRDNYTIDSEVLNGKDVIFALKTGSLESQIQQIIDLCSDIDNGFILLRNACKIFRSSIYRRQVENNLQALAKELPNQHAYSRW
jgi:hypothetical protein